MNIFQKAYNWIKGVNWPSWLKPVIQQLNDLMVAILLNVTQQYISFIKEKIIEASSLNNMSNSEKFEYVFKQAKAALFTFGITLKDNELDLIVQYLVSLLKKQGAIK